MKKMYNYNVGCVKHIINNKNIPKHKIKPFPKNNFGYESVLYNCFYRTMNNTHFINLITLKKKLRGFVVLPKILLFHTFIIFRQINKIQM